MALIAFPTTNWNAYVSLADADAYFADDIRAATWAAFTTAVRNGAIVSATRAIDRQRYVGEPTMPETGHAFPRSGLTDANGDPVDDDAIPAAVTLATYELAFAIATKPAVASSTTTANGVKRVKAGSAEVEFFAGGANQNGKPLPEPAWSLLGPFLASSAAGISAAGFYQSGAGVETPDDDYSPSPGYN